MTLQHSQLIVTRQKKYLEVVHAVKIDTINSIISSPPILKINGIVWRSCLSGKRIYKRMKHLNLFSYPMDLKIRAQAPLQASEK